VPKGVLRAGIRCFRTNLLSMRIPKTNHSARMLAGVPSVSIRHFPACGVTKTPCTCMAVAARSPLPLLPTQTGAAQEIGCPIHEAMAMINNLTCVVIHFTTSPSDPLSGRTTVVLAMVSVNRRKPHKTWMHIEVDHSHEPVAVHEDYVLHHPGQSHQAAP